ncbi:uncharacterized protein N7506_006846 [Penicillium brevicompactum]|uniref:uncharacterized protein n=1 Tax=Penicillium brevicompactum TaxID=5074 RepID=UPI00253F7F4C|nr:uncharacterized protein N7506_006846 [Penicillium brevicompactum]KAJ5333063.1 hypothetical protein N7506_006846 [Penicillium brevicompactum]
MPTRNPATNEPSEAVTGNGHVDLNSMRNWQLRDAPSDPGIITDNKCSEGTVFWDPSRAWLTDAGLVFTLLTLTVKQRKEIFVWDFTSAGDPRCTRVPKGPTVVVMQNNVRCLLAWKGMYIFTGGHKLAGWLLNTKYPDPERGREAGWFQHHNEVRLILDHIRDDH